MHSFKKLDIWKRSRVFCTSIYRLTNDFPDTEKFGLVVQLRRAAVSVPSNIAEGTSRRTKKDFRRFLDFAIGSLYEIETQLLIAQDLNYIDSSIFNTINSDLQSIIKMTSKFKSTMK
ncbi:four helix bundle protein [Flavobacteriaceae bacterium R33]|uniref:Four helix bundle protein n=2 Tax=Poritiphilus flavus TaxID=2697053 RepID=A0A6L9EF97_9FLAO|nr:four helix bundle protein [Poritiphilus flavus]